MAIDNSLYISSLLINDEKERDFNLLEKAETDWLKENYNTISIAIDPTNPPV